MIVVVLMLALASSPPYTKAADEGGVDIPVTAPSAIVSDAMLKLFEPRVFSDGGPGQSQQTYYYRLFKPAPKPDSERLPMIVWLHGHGQYELTVHNRGQLAYIQNLVLDDLEHPDKYPFFILAVQCPEDLQWTSSTSAPNDASVQDPADAVITIVESLLRELPIDSHRIYLVGISSGGSATWEMVQRRPDLFAAAAPLACVPRAFDAKDLGRMAIVPIWSFRSLADKVPPMSVAQSTVNQLRSINGKCVLTEVDTGTHDCWTTAFLDYNLLDWLLSQSRGCNTCPYPGSITIGTRWQLLCSSYLYVRQWGPPLGVLGGAALACYAVRREWLRGRRKVRT